MSFEIDNQTLDDLNIFPKTKIDSSIFKFFNKTKTSGGQSALIEMMKNPSDDFELLSARIEAIHFIQNNNIPFPFTEKKLDFILHYFQHNAPPLNKSWIYALSDWITDLFIQSNDYYVITKGIKYLKEFLYQVKNYIGNFQESKLPKYLQDIVHDINDILSSDFFHLFLFTGKKSKKLKSINYFDHYIRTTEKENALKIINIVFQLDALITVAKAGKENNFSLPAYHENGDSLINIENAFHPFVKEPVPNSISLDQNINMCFLTGANMAGKSTFLKSAGLCCYLAHIGFPVPAGKMQTSVFSGLITTINLADNVSIGYSHFYSEVKRVKNTALKIQEKRKILVIFDELFRGTNVKDAYDASLMIISAFADISQCAFFISTHIVEIADELKKKRSIVFKYFESDVVNETPVYSYKLMNGISAERHGLRIVKNEKILEILNEIIQEEK